MLKEISNDNDIVEITGEYTGSIGGWGASHEYRHLAYLENYSSVSSSAALLLQKQVQKKQEKEQIQYKKTRPIKRNKNSIQGPTDFISDVSSKC
ncbi:MAG TPA: hypothetical protein VFJ51_02345 [Nitrososphaeraceae archaeon]|nr:hypothetical protein [Nitrososphaeraceae archaeon]